MIVTIDGLEFTWKPGKPATPADDNLPCGFCGRYGFDRYGLKYHLMMGYCEVFDDISSDEE